MDINDLRQRRAAALTEARSILKAEKVAPEDEKRATDLMTEIDSLDLRIKAYEVDRPLRTAPLAGRDYLGGDSPRPLADGEIRMLRPDESIRSVVHVRDEERELSFGKYFRGIVTGDWRGADAERRAMSEGVLGAGGYMVPTPISSQIIDLARNKAVIFNAGARTIPMESATLKVARLTGDVTAGWKSENAIGTFSDASLDSVTFNAQMLVALVKMSVELAEDAPNAESVVANSIAHSLALELDRAALYGSGVAPQPKGVVNQAGVVLDTTTMGANGSAPTNFDFLSKAVSTIWTNNGAPNAYVVAPRTAGEADRLKDTQNRTLLPPPSVAALKALVSNQVPTNLTQGTSAGVTSDAIVADFSELLVGLRASLQMEVSREAGDASGGAFSAAQIWVRAFLRADIQLAHPNHFVVVRGIL